VAECAVIGVKDLRWGERPLALIVPQKILFVEALAKASVGKFDKKALRAQYGDSA
jgi:fatty-acyl-CoA synthase